jgi:hypothetical protein
MLKPLAIAIISGPCISAAAGFDRASFSARALSPEAEWRTENYPNGSRTW